MQSGTYSAEEDRMVTSMLVDRTFDTDGNFINLQGGVVPPKAQVRPHPGSGTNMTLKISSGMIIVPITSIDPPGAYLCYNDSDWSADLAVASGANPRYDLVIAEVLDATLGDVSSQWQFRVIAGTPGANPTSPNAPDGTIPICRVKVIPAASNGGTNKITTGQVFDLRRFVASPGGVHITWSDNPNPSHSPGRMVYDATNKSLYLSDGTGWTPVYTYKEWLSYFAAYRAQQVVLNDYAYTSQEDWIARPKRTDNDNPIGSEIAIGRISTPTGRLKVSLTSFGKVDTTDASGHISVTVKRKGNGVVVFDPEITRSIGFYHKAWGHHGGTWIIGSLPENTDLIIALRFTRRNENGKATFGKTILVAEPII